MREWARGFKGVTSSPLQGEGGLQWMEAYGIRACSECVPHASSSRKSNPHLHVALDGYYLSHILNAGGDDETGGDGYRETGE
ncbi:hypothetical protein ACTXT7_013336 [Hymenolepis weldensis]